MVVGEGGKSKVKFEIHECVYWYSSSRLPYPFIPTLGTLTHLAREGAVFQRGHDRLPHRWQRLAGRT